MRALAPVTAFSAAAFACILQTSDAGACGVAYPQGNFARFSKERSLIVWDAARKTEHFIRALTLQGDPETFGVFVPTPSVPVVAKENDAIIDHIAELVTPPAPPPTGGGGGGGPRSATAGAVPSVQVMARTQIGDFEAVTLKASDETALGDWLAQHKFVDKPTLRQWEKTYLDKKWLITAVRCTANGAGDRSLEVPTMRMSFTIDAPFFPYVEVPADATDESAYRAKYLRGAASPYGGAYYGSRPFDVYVVATTPMQSMLGNATGGPGVADAVRVSGGALASALGDTKAWSFSPESEPRWVITHLSENTWARVATSDITFASYDLPKPRPGAGITEADDRYTGPTFPSHGGQPSWNPAKPTKPVKSHRLRYLAIGLFFLVAGAAGFAVFSEQEKKKP